MTAFGGPSGPLSNNEREREAYARLLAQAFDAPAIFRQSIAVDRDHRGRSSRSRSTGRKPTSTSLIPLGAASPSELMRQFHRSAAPMSNARVDIPKRRTPPSSSPG